MSSSQSLVTNKKDPAITIKVIKYMIMDHYECPPDSKYCLELLTESRKNQVLTRINQDNVVRDVNRPVIATKINCWECGLEIFVHSLVVSNKFSKGRKRRYHFRCALKKKLVEEKTKMHEDYRKFLLGILI
jgi:hypothetical protein